MIQGKLYYFYDATHVNQNLIDAMQLFKVQECNAG